MLPVVMVVGVMGNLFLVVVVDSSLFVVVAVDNGLPSQLTGQRALCHLFKLTGLAAKNRTQTPKQTRTRVERKEYNVRRQRMSCCGCVGLLTLSCLVGANGRVDRCWEKSCPDVDSFPCA